MLIAVTGGIASGKSTVSRRLAEHGAVRIDADQLARDVVEPGTEGLQAVVSRFGEGVLAEDGSLDRAALGAIVFSDPDERKALEAITHPRIQALAAARIRSAYAEDQNAVIVYEIPLLVESRSVLDFDVVVVANADTRTRLERMTALRGLSRADAQRRLTSQAPETARLAVADVVIDTNGTLDHTLQQVDDLWTRLTVRPE